MDIKTRGDSFVFGLGRVIGFEPNVMCWTTNGIVRFNTYAGPNEHQIRLTSSTRVTDDRWHNIEITRLGDTWSMKIDSETEAMSDDRPIVTFPTTPLYIGNRPLKDDFRVAAFSGCVKNVTIGTDDNPPFVTFGSVAKHCANF